MFAPPPKMTMVIVYSTHPELLVAFYEGSGMLFNKEIDEHSKLAYYDYLYVPFTFRIAEVRTPEECSRNLSIRFLIDEIEGYVPNIINAKGSVHGSIWVEDGCKHLMIKDPDGNSVDLMTAYRISPA